MGMAVVWCLGSGYRLRRLRSYSAAKCSFDARGVGALHDLACIGGDAAAQEDHLPFTQATAPLILTGEAGQYLCIRSGEPDAVAFNGGLAALLVGGLVLVDAHQGAQGPAVIAGKAMAQLFDHVFLAHG